MLFCFSGIESELSSFLSRVIFGGGMFAEDVNEKKWRLKRQGLFNSNDRDDIFRAGQSS